MELRDLIVTPLLLILVYVVAYVVRPYVTDGLTYRYFIPALTVRIVGALAVGFIYQFYYGGDGGDTFGYHTHGSRHIWNAIMESPVDGFRIFFSAGRYGPGLWEASEKIWYWRDPSSFFVIRVATIFDLITFSSYTGTATLFAIVAFLGSWMLFNTFYRINPEFHKWIAFATLFVPTTVFWGSGIFKDSLTLAALGAATFCFYELFLSLRIRIWKALLLLLSLWVIYTIKIYILLCFLPSLLIWLFISRLSKIYPVSLRIIIGPFVLVTALVMGYYAVDTIAKDNPRYNLQALSETAQITAYDIRYGWGARTGEGSGFTLGTLDGSWQSMLKLALPAINVTLFRPYLWEVKNPLMLISSLESTVLLFMTVWIILRVRSQVFRYLLKPPVLFCLTFALIFAFGVGVSTLNFGTLSRYKIPVLPYYILTLGFIYNYWKSDKKLDEFESTEY